VSKKYEKVKSTKAVAVKLHWKEEEEMDRMIEKISITRN
jgi:metal-sulfur cluster biosynthetic enzyme